MQTKEIPARPRMGRRVRRGLGLISDQLAHPLMGPLLVGAAAEEGGETGRGDVRAAVQWLQRLAERTRATEAATGASGTAD